MVETFASILNTLESSIKVTNKKVNNKRSTTFIANCRVVEI